VPRSASCPRCLSDLRCCLNCRFFDADAHHGCREEQASWVKEKDRGNFCSYFSPATAQVDLAAHTAAAKASLDALFSGLPGPPPEAPAAAGLSADLERFLRSKR
jgi:hypothetical protein